MGSVKSLSNLFAAVLHDCAVECHTDPSPDIRKGIRRIEQEGSGFLTLTLPLLAEALELGLERGALDLTALTSFAQKGGLPLFLGGFLRRVFDTSGRLLDDPCVDAVRCIRQICLMWKKIQLPCDESRIRLAFTNYVEADKEIPDESTIERTHPRFLQSFDFVSRVLWTDVLAEASHIAAARSSIPRHGPGATAERIRGNTKYLLRTWHERLETYFPFDQFGVSSPLWCLEESLQSDVSFLSPGAEPPVRVISVPKTMKGPRIIAIEPVCMQYTQQALMATIVSALESHQLTSGRIGFSDQSVNQSLALASSIDGSLATLDLKEASDRVPLWGVVRMLQGVPDLLGALLSCRSTHADVPGHGKIQLRKFASMGSATCFPVEAMYFFTAIIAGRLLSRGDQLSVKRVRRLARSTYVYGDDILVPRDEVDVVVDSLQATGLKVNTRKSFWTGKFRESCGMDAFKGVRVTPVYVRRTLPTTTADAAGVLSWVSLGNQLYMAGYWGAAKYVRAEVENLLGPLPMVDPEAGCLGWHSIRRTVSVQGWNRNLHSFTVKTYTTRSVWRDDHIDGHPALMKCLLKSEGTSVDPLAYLSGLAADGRHLQRTVRSVALSTKRRWVSPF
jgi:hypothetical protein